MKWVCHMLQMRSCESWRTFADFVELVLLLNIWYYGPHMSIFSKTASKMIDAESGVEAFIRRIGLIRGYTEYEIPLESRLHAQRGNACCIEAVTDDRYCVELKLPKTFDLKGYPKAKMSIAIDGTELISYVFDHATIAGGYGRYSASSCYVNIGNGSKTYGLSFGETQIGKSSRCPQMSVADLNSEKSTKT